MKGLSLDEQGLDKFQAHEMVACDPAFPFSDSSTVP